MKKFVLLLSLFIGAPVYAEAPQNTNIAGPSAVATGNVTNQAVQVLQGPYPSNSYGPGIVCSGPAMTIAPFVTGNLSGSADPSQYQGHTANGGFTIGFSIPLDGGLTELCKERARAAIARERIEEQKARLDFELVRAMRCGQMMREGVRFHPSSPYAAVCADIMVINITSESVNNETPVSEGQGT